MKGIDSKLISMMLEKLIGQAEDADLSPIKSKLHGKDEYHEGVDEGFRAGVRDEAEDIDRKEDHDEDDMIERMEDVVGRDLDNDKGEGEEHGYNCGGKVKKMADGGEVRRDKTPAERMKGGMPLEDNDFEEVIKLFGRKK